MTVVMDGARQDIRRHRGKTAWTTRCRMLVGLAGCVLIAVLGGFVMLAISLFTLFRCRRFNAEVLTKWMTRAGLWLCGIRVRVHPCQRLGLRQTVYISNHTSALDMFVLISLGLPDTRYFLSGFLRRLLPLCLIGYLIGIFWTPRQAFPARRTRLFRRAERVLRRTGESVFLTPEGQRIGVFNKGAFHLATNLRAPIVPIYIDIPDDVDPGPWSGDDRFDPRPGTVDVYFKPTIDTSDWTLERLEENRDRVKSLYVEWVRRHRGELPEAYAADPGRTDLARPA